MILGDRAHVEGARARERGAFFVCCEKEARHSIPKQERFTAFCTRTDHCTGGWGETGTARGRASPGRGLDGPARLDQQQRAVARGDAGPAAREAHANARVLGRLAGAACGRGGLRQARRRSGVEFSPPFSLLPSPPPGRPLSPFDRRDRATYTRPLGVCFKRVRAGLALGVC